MIAGSGKEVATGLHRFIITEICGSEIGKSERIGFRMNCTMVQFQKEWIFATLAITLRAAIQTIYSPEQSETMR